METTRQIELHYQALVDEYKVYVDDVVKSLGFIVIALGWVVTSDGARTFLKGNHANKVALVAIAILAVCNFAVYLGHYTRSTRLQRLITSLDPDCYEVTRNYLLTPLHIAVNCTTIGALFALLLVLVATLR